MASSGHRNSTSEQSTGETSTGSLDQALLESLFYNEMMQLAGDGDEASSLPSQLFNAVASNDDSQTSVAGMDPQLLAERSLLNDFGVNSLPVTDVPENAAVQPATQGNESQPQLPPQPLPTTSMNPQPVAAMPQPSQYHAAVPPQQAPPPSYPNEKRNKLVSQFATLASRLGINLPPHVLQSLTTTAAVNEATGATSYAASASTAFPLQANGASYPPMAPTSQPLPDVKPAPAVKQLESTAEAAIQAATKKRSPDASNEMLSYSKRRKKPRLADCEQRLKQLKAENEVLKRHLHTVSNQSHNFDQERIAAEKRMRTLLESEATGEELDTAIKNFTELYSDYGHHRQRELDFHLAQLQRLANPTNFTKMGLYSLENSKDPKNAVAGILQKELGITSQQGRKILEQRQKIRDVLANLKECFALIGKLQSLCEQKTKIFHDRMNKCREILSPKQVVKLLIWIDEHSQLLETVCPGWGSEQIHTKAPPPQQPK